MFRKQIMPAAISALMLTACVTTQTTAPTVSSTCLAYCEIQYDADADSPETVVQVIGHNAAYRANCPARACVIDQERVDAFRANLR